MDWSLATFIWVLCGVIAFIWSLVCFGKSGTTLQKVGGLILSLLFGPFALIYIVLMKQYAGYCN
jgi:uncharacterized membrane protein